MQMQMLRKYRLHSEIEFMYCSPLVIIAPKPDDAESTPESSIKPGSSAVDSSATASVIKKKNRSNVEKSLDAVFQKIQKTIKDDFLRHITITSSA